LPGGKEANRRRRRDELNAWGCLKWQLQPRELRRNKDKVGGSRILLKLEEKKNEIFRKILSKQTPWKS